MRFHGQAGQDQFVLACLGGKTGGHFLEIGSHHAININNSYVLEKEFGWTGLLVDHDSSHVPSYEEHRTSPYIIQDARTVDYKGLLEEYQFPPVVDYLQIDLDVTNGSIISTLEWLESTVFPHYTFSVVTFEHDIYRGNFYETRDRSRVLFQKWGYVRLFGDVKNEGNAYEDWYVHPDSSPESWVDRVATEESLEWQEILERIDKHRSQRALLVTAFYHMSDTVHTTGFKDWDHRLEHFLRVAESGFRILVFTDETYGSFLREKVGENVRVDTTTFPTLSSTVTSSIIHSTPFPVELPLHRHPEKDSVDYMTLQMAKTEFVAHALTMEEYRDVDKLAWFDFSVARLLSHEQSVYYRFMARLNTCTPSQIAIPGCWDAARVTDVSLFHAIAWRFCGGFFCGDRRAIGLFDSAVRDALPVFLQERGILAWEVNVWAWVEKRRPELFRWYAGDHNDSIL